MQTRRLRNSGRNNYLLISNGEQPVKTLNRNGCFFYCSNTAVNVTPFWAGHTERERMSLAAVLSLPALLSHPHLIVANV